MSSEDQINTGDGGFRFKAPDQDLDILQEAEESKSQIVMPMSKSIELMPSQSGHS